jgi:hypothetical protein
MKPLLNIDTARWRTSHQATAHGCPRVSRMAEPSLSAEYAIGQTSDAFAMLTLVGGRPGSSG